MREPVWAIKQWDEVFEDFRSREVSRLVYVRWPLDRKSEACALLMQTREGIFTFGIFARLVEVAARGTPRGVLRDEKGPLTPARLQARTGISAKLLERGISILSGPECGWLIPWDEPPTAHRPRIDGRTDGAPTEASTCAGARARRHEINNTDTDTRTTATSVVEALQQRGVRSRKAIRELAEAGVTVSMIQAHGGKPPGVIVEALKDDLAAGAATGRAAEDAQAWLESRTPEERDELRRAAIGKLPAESPYRKPEKVEQTRTFRNVVARAMAGRPAGGGER